MTFKAAILANEMKEDHIGWVRACSKYKQAIECKVIDLTAFDWLEKVKSEPFDVFLAKPGGFTERFKNLYDERCYIIENELGLFLYPSLKEILIYENKRLLSYWLSAHGIPHPRTYVFYNEAEALEFARTAGFPVMAKYNIGGSGSGVYKLEDRTALESYIRRSFSVKGAPRRWGPNLRQKGLLLRGIRYLFQPGKLGPRLKVYHEIQRDSQMKMLILQEYIMHEYEWRVVVIGNSYFAHKKMKNGDRASGSLRKEYEKPPVELLQYCRDIMEKFGFYSQAIDLFDTSDRGFLVNEMQCIFGQSDPYQMLIEGQSGRYVYRKKHWSFEPGDFNSNESYDLRVSHVLELLKEKLS